MSKVLEEMPDSAFDSAFDFEDNMFDNNLMDGEDGESKEKGSSSAKFISFDNCSACGDRTVQINCGYQCSSCNLVIEIDVDQQSRAVPKYNDKRLLIVGSKSHYYQSDLDRSGDNCNTESQKAYKVYNELIARNNRWNNIGEQLFTKDVLRRAASYYCMTQRSGQVCRNENKRMILAACVKYSCFELGFIRADSEIAGFFTLQTKGFARGEAFLRGATVDNNLEIEVNQDLCLPNINTAFAVLNLTDHPNKEIIIECITEIINVANDNDIGVSSFMRSKVIASMFMVLHRSGNGEKYPLIRICSECGIRKNTLMKFLKELFDYHSYFEEVYDSFGFVNKPIEFK